MANHISQIRQLLEPILPPILFRNHPQFKAWTGFSPRTLANEDSQGTGPDERIFSGRVCGYPKDAILRWLEKRSRSVDGKEAGK